MVRRSVNSNRQMVRQYEDGDSGTNCFLNGGRAIVPRADDRGATSKLAAFLLLAALTLTGVLPCAVELVRTKWRPR
ncbi:hypothetical protein GCM10017712_24310 [Curtobacterium citreum]